MKWGGESTGHRASAGEVKTVGWRIDSASTGRRRAAIGGAWRGGAGSSSGGLGELEKVDDRSSGPAGLEWTTLAGLQLGRL
jgi:hypothetical protein